MTGATRGDHTAQRALEWELAQQQANHEDLGGGTVLCGGEFLQRSRQGGRRASVLGCSSRRRVDGDVLHTRAALWLGNISYGINFIHGLVLWLTFPP